MFHSLRGSQLWSWGGVRLPYLAESDSDPCAENISAAGPADTSPVPKREASEARSHVRIAMRSERGSGQRISAQLERRIAAECSLKRHLQLNACPIDEALKLG